MSPAEQAQLSNWLAARRHVNGDRGLVNDAPYLCASFDLIGDVAEASTWTWRTPPVDHEREGWF